MRDAERHTLAVFDFDGTLIKGDSLWPFLGLAAGWLRTFLALAEALVFWGMKSSLRRERKDFYTFIKGHLLWRLLATSKPQTFAVATEKLRQRLKWNEPMRRELHAHRAAGHHVVIASGGLDLYLPHLLQDVPFDALVCTQLEIKNGIVTGAMLSGNCVRQRKAEMVADYMAQNGPFAESWGYGNFPQDLPMLELVKYRIIV